MITQLNPSIPVNIIENNKGCPAGSAECVGWIDYSQEHDLLWIVFMDATGECWQVPNYLIRAFKNVSIGRTGG